MTTSGIARMRNHVSVFGRLNTMPLRLPRLLGMEMPIDRLGQLARDALDLDEILDAGPRDGLEAPELPQQVAAALRAESPDLLERRRRLAPLPPRPMTRDREAVRLVAHLLDQMQRRRRRRQRQRARAAGDVEPLPAGP